MTRMKQETIREILNQTDYIRISGSEEEKMAAEYLRSLCEAYGAEARIESFEVDTAVVHEASLTASFSHPASTCSTV